MSMNPSQWIEWLENQPTDASEWPTSAPANLPALKHAPPILPDPPEDLHILSRKEIFFLPFLSKRESEKIIFMCREEYGVSGGCCFVEVHCEGSQRICLGLN